MTQHLDLRSARAAHTVHSLRSRRTQQVLLSQLLCSAQVLAIRYRRKVGDQRVSCDAASRHLLHAPAAVHVAWFLSLSSSRARVSSRHSPSATSTTVDCRPVGPPSRRATGALPEGCMEALQSPVRLPTDPGAPRQKRPAIRACRVPWLQSGRSMAAAWRHAGVGEVPLYVSARRTRPHSPLSSSGSHICTPATDQSKVNLPFTGRPPLSSIGEGARRSVRSLCSRRRGSQRFAASGAPRFATRAFSAPCSQPPEGRRASADPGRLALPWRQRCRHRRPCRRR